MPPRTNSFQRLIAFIEAQLAPHGARVTESAMLPALDGSGEREVDVLIEGSIGDHPVRIALECRAHGRPQPVTWIEQLQGTYSNLPVDKVIAVSRSGFTKTALTRAGLLGITTYTLKEALATDWPEHFTQWRAGLLSTHFRLDGAQITYVKEEPGLQGDALKGARVEGPGGAGPSTVAKDVEMLYQQHSESSLREITEKNLQDWFGDLSVEHDVFIPFDAHNRAVIVDGKRFPIKQIIVRVKCKLELTTSEHHHFTYREAKVTTTAVPFDSERTAHFTLLHDEAGKPRTLNIRLDETGSPRKLPRGEDA